MRSTITVTLLLAGAALSLPALAQPSTTPLATTNSGAMAAAVGEWRASKVVGLNVYDAQDAKVGDIEEVLIDPSGKVAGAVIGVGGFLGIGEHFVLIPFNQIKFVNAPVGKTTVTTTTTTTTTTQPTTTVTPTRPVTPNTSNTSNTPITATTRSANEKWYPDHAVINATKDQLKAMAQFKFN